MTDAPVHYLKISIKDPMRSHDGFGAHINYQIDTNSNIPGYIYGDTNVIRRYSDFTWLSTELSRVCAGCIVPALPEKQTVGRFYPEFVESRRRALERFLVNVAAHKELNTSPVFIAFLQADDAALHAAKDYSVIATKKISTKAIAWFEEKVNVMTIGKVTRPINLSIVLHLRLQNGNVLQFFNTSLYESNPSNVSFPVCLNDCISFRNHTIANVNVCLND